MTLLLIGLGICIVLGSVFRASNFLDSVSPEQRILCNAVADKISTIGAILLIIVLLVHEAGIKL